MRYRFLLPALGLLLPATIYGQSKIKRDFFTVSATGQYYFNKAYVENDAMPSQYMRAKNTAGYRIGLGFEHVTRYGLILCTGLEYGQQQHDVSIVYNLTGFDQEATIALDNYEWVHSVKVTSNYFYPYIMAGYQYPISKKYTLVGKLGLGAALCITGLEKYIAPTVIYTTDDGKETRQVQLGVENISLGETQESGKSPRFSQPISTGEIYLGLDRALYGKVIKKLSVGLTMTRGIFWNNSSQYILLNSAVQLNGYPVNGDAYRNRNFSIGLRVGVGL